MTDSSSVEFVTRSLDFEIKFAHGEGHTVFAINETKSKLYTGGSDGEVRVWSLEKNDDDPESYDVGSAIYSLTVSSDDYYVASDSIDVKHYDLDGNYKGSLVRSTLNVYSIALSDDQKFLASGGGDFIIKIVNLEDRSIKQITGHEAPILSLKFDPKRKYLASSSCDGSVQVWNVNDLKDIKLVKKFDNNHAKSNDYFNSSIQCVVDWSTDGGSLLAIPNDNTINFYERDLWTCKFSLKYEGFKTISICAFDKSNKYFAASNSTGILIVWNLNFKETPIAVYVNESNTLITCIQFNPLNKEKLIATDKNGQLIYMNVKPDEKMKQLVKENDNMFAKIEDSNDPFDDEFDDAAFLKDLDNIDMNMKSQKSQASKKELMESDEDEIVPKEKFTLSRFSSTKKNRVIESDDDDENSHQTTRTESQSRNLADIDPNEFDKQFDDDDDDAMFDLGKLRQQYESKINALNESSDQKPADNNLDQEEHKIINIKVKPIFQTAFQPGSTPVELEHRFMVWNSVGIVTCNRTDNENIIDVEFHNSDVFRPIHLPNTYNYTMADLNTDSLLLACVAIENEESTPSILFCMNFNSWDSNKEWRYQLPADESIEAITLSSNFVLAATDQRIIRLFTSSGIQLHLLSIPGPIVCLRAQDNLLQMIYHNGSGLPGEQSVAMNLLRLNDKSVYPISQLNASSVQIPASLSPKSVIEWAGFTDEGNASIVDSMGIVKLFNLKSNCWIPVVDLKSKNKNDHYFVISMSEIQEQIRCISCKGAKYPATIPKPDVYSLPFEIPLCEISTTKAKLEEQLIRLSLKKSLLENLSSSGFDVDFTNEENTKKQIEILIKLFALAVNGECNSLAIEIAGLMPNQMAIEGAIRYATQKNRLLLINKLNKLSREKFNPSNAIVDEEQKTERQLLNDKTALYREKKKRRAQESSEEALKPKQIKLTNNSNPFRIDQINMTDEQ